MAFKLIRAEFAFHDNGPQYSVTLQSDVLDEAGQLPQPVGPLNVAQARKLGWTAEKVASTISAALMAENESLRGERQRLTDENAEIAKVRDGHEATIKELYDKIEQGAQRYMRLLEEHTLRVAQMEAQFAAALAAQQKQQEVQDGPAGV